MDVWQLAPLPAAGRALASDIRSAAKTTTPALSSSSKVGAAVWGRAGCGTCHTLAAVGSSGTKGPDLDVLRLSPTEIAAKVRAGGGGMPAFAKRLAPAKIDALAAFVSSAEAQAAANTSQLDAYAAVGIDPPAAVVDGPLAAAATSASGVRHR